MAQLTARYQAALARLRQATAAVVGTAWDTLEAYNTADVETFVEDAVAASLAGQATAVVATDAYTATLLGRPPLGAPTAQLTGAALRAGTPPDIVYRRPFVVVWAGLAAGKPWADMVAAGRAQATTAAATDIALATRAAASWIGENDDGITGYVRVPDGNACELCLAAAGTRYRTDDVMPIHPNCGCTLEPLTSGTAPRAHPEPPGPATVEEHDELGPILATEGENFATLGT